MQHILLQRDDDYITITAQRITFGKNEQPVAYISNNKLYISDAHITSQFDIGYTDGGDGKWRVMGEPGRGYVIKWIGGAVT